MQEYLYNAVCVWAREKNAKYTKVLKMKVSQSLYHNAQKSRSYWEKKKKKKEKNVHEISMQRVHTN